MVGTADPGSEKEPASPGMFSGSNDGYALTDNSSIQDPSCRSTLSSFKTQSGLKSQFSIVHKSSDASKFEQDMRNYARLFQRGNTKAGNSCQLGRSRLSW